MIIIDLINVILINISVFNLYVSIFSPTWLLVLIYLIWSSNDVVPVKIFFFCSIIFDGNLYVVSFITLVPSERHSVSDLSSISSFPISFFMNVFLILTALVLSVVFQLFHVVYQIIDQTEQTWLVVLFQSNILTYMMVVVL